MAVVAGFKLQHLLPGPRWMRAPGASVINFAARISLSAAPELNSTGLKDKE